MSICKERLIIKKILAISDIHGCYDEFCMLLDKVKYNPNEHQLILLGDYVDRGLKSKQVLDKIIDLHDKGAIVLRGNHDQMFLDWLYKDSPTYEDVFVVNGGLSTVTSYLGPDWFQDGVTSELLDEARSFILKHYTYHFLFLKDTQLYHEIDKYVFVHAGVNPFLDNWKKSSSDDFLWIRDEFIYEENYYDDHIFIHGHTPTITLHGRHDIYFRRNKIDIDGACCFGGQLNCLIIDNEDYYVESLSNNKTTPIG